MFQPRSKDFLDPRMTAIAGHLRAIQDELGEIGKSAGRRGSASAVSAGNQIADTLAPILNDIVGRFRYGRRAALNQAASAQREAVKVGAKAGSKALRQVARRTRQQPIMTIAVALGIGILIGTASRWS
ncbi:MAG: hypothetical protein ACRECE_11995 [Xanthobacteraceae bacterium]